MTGPPATSDVAVIMPVRDGEPYLAAAIESILEQTAPPAEIIVIDDGSTDGTADVLARYGASLRVLRQEPAGQFAAMNRGIAASRSPLLAFLDSDDLFTQESLATRVARITAADRPDAVFGRTEQFISPELAPEDAARIRFIGGPQRGEMFQTMLIRRAAADRVGPLAGDLRTSANIDWISRARAAGVRSVQIDDVVARRRLHRTNIGLTQAASKRDDLLAVIRAHRRRTHGHEHEKP